MRMKCIATIGNVVLSDKESKNSHVYYFQKDIGDEDLDFEISQLIKFYEHGVVYREGIRGFEVIW